MDHGKNTYDPKKKKYKKEYSAEDYIIEMMKKMPLKEFKDIFGLSNAEVSNDEYHKYLFECYCAYCCPELDFFLFQKSFPNAEINEESFERKVTQTIERFELVSFETFCKKG